MRFFLIVLAAIIFLYLLEQKAYTQPTDEDCYTDQCIAERFCADAPDVNVCIFGEPLNP